MDEQEKTGLELANGVAKIAAKEVVAAEEERSLAMGLLSDMKESSKREAAAAEKTIKRLWVVILAFAAVIVAQFCVNTYERMQYDYVSSYEATGAYAIISSDGTVIGGDYSADEIQKMLEAALEFRKTQNDN